MMQPQRQDPLEQGPRPRDNDDAFEAWLERVTERADPFMAWLGVLFALLVGFELAVELSPQTSTLVGALGWAMWSVFLVEFVAKAWLAPNKLRFFRRQWLQAVMLTVPALRLLRFLRLLRLGRALPAARVVSSSYRSAGTAKRLARSRLGYLAGISVVAAVGLAELAYLFERNHPDRAFDSFGHALIWSFSTVLALQGDPLPASVAGRIAMLVGFAFGLVIVTSLAATLGAFFVEERRERAELEEGDRVG